MIALDIHYLRLGVSVMACYLSLLVILLYLRYLQVELIGKHRYLILRLIKAEDHLSLVS